MALAHTLQNVDPASKKANCSVCGETLAMPYFDHNGNLFWRCQFEPWPYSLDGVKQVRHITDRESGIRIVVSHKVIFAIFVRQKGKCAACKKKLTRRMNIDHCHRSKKVRGLLCNNCNSAAGMLGDDPKRLRMVADYLERFTAGQ